ncbi:hypothetical protein PsYK624_079990 [Phanerochaete sordida]|uniref:DUF6534 domain-containing protein n=1 Tax=Phanerochaete sordida TaxID=48140 RepID=A0A9P3G9G7_9APHY|nr:hypothetical protein PsYK624_079990 [Phanerochaete sordida]
MAWCWYRRRCTTAGIPNRLWLKIYVFVLIFANTLNNAFNMAWIYGVLVNDFGNFESLTRANWLQASQHAFCGIISMMVQLFYARRIWILVRSRLLVAVIVGTSCVSGLAAIGSAIAVGMRPAFSELQSFESIGLIWLISCSVCDISIAAILSIFLSRQKTGFTRTDTVLKLVIRSTVSNGVLTASFTIGHMISWLSTPLGIHFIFNYGVVKLYTNSVIASLNSRSELAARASMALSAPIVDVKDLNFANASSTPSVAGSQCEHISISMGSPDMPASSPGCIHEHQDYDYDPRYTEDITSSRTTYNK